MILILSMRLLRHRKMKGLSHGTEVKELIPRLVQLLSPLTLIPGLHCLSENDGQNKQQRRPCEL